MENKANQEKVMKNDEYVLDKLQQVGQNQHIAGTRERGRIRLKHTPYE